MLKRFSIIAFVLLNIGCDQISKNIVRRNVEPMEYIQIMGDNLILTNVENTGAMLGFGQDFSPTLKLILLQGLPLIVLLILLVRTSPKIKSKPMDGACIYFCDWRRYRQSD